MKKTLYEVDTDNGVLKTLEGDEYIINPSDLPICCTWIPTTELEIKMDRGAIICTNLENGISIQLDLI